MAVSKYFHNKTIYRFDPFLSEWPMTHSDTLEVRVTGLH